MSLLIMTASNRRHAIILGVILATGVLLRLAVAPMGAHPGDFATLTRWAGALGAHSLLDIYQVTDANYPPLTMALLAGSRWLYGLAAPGDPAGPAWMILLKLPAILADLGIGWLVWRIADRRGGPSAWMLAAVVFNPALIYLSAWWGQYESVYMLGVLAAMLDALDGRLFRAGLWLGAGLMVKLQAGVILPVIVVAALSDGAPLQSQLGRMARFSGGLALPLLISLGPYAAAGQLTLVLLRLVALVSAPSWLTVNALNLWYLVTGGAGNWRFNAPLVMPDSTAVAPGLSAHDLGLGLLILWSALVLGLSVYASRNVSHPGSAKFFPVGALLYLGVFLWPTQAHERYAFGAVILMGAAAACRIPQTGSVYNRSLLPYLAITGMHTANLIWASPFNPALEGWFADSQVLGIMIALGFLGIALWWLVDIRTA